MRDACDLLPHHAAERREGRLVALADRQHGVVARAQLIALGYTRHEIGGRLARGLLVQQHRAVYSVARARLTPRGRWMASVLAAGERAVLSHRSAASLWGLRARETKIEVTAPKERRREAIVVHRVLLPADEATVLDAIPVTTAARTLLDLAAVEPRERVERALNEAERLRLADATPLGALLERYPRRPGTPMLRAILAAAGDGITVTRSELEDRFLALVHAAGLPRPQTNVLVAGFEVDCAWPYQRLVVELDGHAFHATRASYESDRARDRALQRAGWRVVRITWRQLGDEADAIAADLAALLGR